MIWKEIIETLNELNEYLKNCYSNRFINKEDKIIAYDKMKIYDYLDRIRWLVDELEEEKTRWLVDELKEGEKIKEERNKFFRK